ncbi:MAG: hypothetical protein ACR2H2_15090 [Solirubrobacteraceae bacterium]
MLYVYWCIYGLRRYLGSFRELWSLLVLFATVSAGVTWAPSSAGREFFSAAAQVIPVLLLALAVESRMFRLRRFAPRPLDAAMPKNVEEAWRVVQSQAPSLATWLERLAHDSQSIMRHDTLVGGAVYGGMLLLMLVGAEWYCLDVLASMTEGETSDPAFVSGAILAGLVGVAIIALVGSGDKQTDPASHRIDTASSDTERR